MTWGYFCVIILINNQVFIKVVINIKRENGKVCGVGISDNGKYQKWVNNKDTREYAMWQKMIARCYYDKNQDREPTYQGCIVSDEFLSFQTFAEFYNQNKWTDDRKLIPDKDILTHGKSKIYSRDTIVFVDDFIDKIFTRRQRFRVYNFHGELVVNNLQ